MEDAIRVELTSHHLNTRVGWNVGSLLEFEWHGGSLVVKVRNGGNKKYSSSESSFNGSRDRAMIDLPHPAFERQFREWKVICHP